MNSLHLKPLHLTDESIYDLQNILYWLDINCFHEQTLNVLHRHTSDEAGYTEIENQIPSMLEKLDYDYTEFTIKNYISHIELYLKRHVKLVPFDLSTATSGVCVRQTDMDLIFFNKNRHSILQEHIVIHESAHLLFNHQLLSINISEFAGGSSTTDQLSAHFRTYDDILSQVTNDYLPMNKRQEAEAEIFARQFLARVRVHKRHQTLTRKKNTGLFPPFG